jgi:hypothetical protein
LVSGELVADICWLKAFFMRKPHAKKFLGTKPYST